MKVLVTGATGFIGGHLVDALVKKGYEVRCLVRKTSHVQQLTRRGVELAYGDITDMDSLHRVREGIGIVFHLAAIRGERKLPLSMYWEVNVEGTRNMLEAFCRDGAKHFVYVSTIGVLGWVRHPPADERSPYHPEGSYHITKCEAEKLAIEFHKVRRLPVTVIRPVMTYGPDVSGFLFNLARLIKSGKFRQIGDGKNYLHLLDVRNLTQALISVLEKPEAMGQIYIVADNQPITLGEIVTLIADTLKVDIPRGQIPIWLAKLAGLVSGLASKAIPGVAEPLITGGKVDLMTKHRFYDISKAGKELCFEPSVSTEVGIRQTIQWYLDNGYL